MKKFISGLYINNPNYQISLKMKLTSLLLIVTLFQLHANESFSQNEKISLDMEQVTIKSVLNEIELNTDFKFLYEKSVFQIDRIVSLSVKKKKISEVLNSLFKNSNVSIVFIEEQIHIKPNDESIPSKKEEAINIDKVQQIEISGTVTDENGQPLPGASIIIKGTTTGTETDFDGKFSLEIPEGSNYIVVSFIGFKTVEIAIGEQTSFNIQLEEDAAQLDNVVVVGSRGKPRTVFDSPVPIDNIKLSELTNTGKGVLDQQLMLKVPSYNSTQQPISDAAAQF